VLPAFVPEDSHIWARVGFFEMWCVDHFLTAA
jgi:hypothetical protein